MSSEKFRRQLRHESEQWWTEGLIDAALYEQLAARYQFEQLEGEASNRFIMILMGLGAVLLGLGAVTFVAANWQIWSRSLKMLVLISTFIGVNATGFYLWRKPTSQKGLQRLGQSLLLLGALLLGANLGLMSQLFHQSGELYELLVVWGLGVTIMAYSLRLTSLGFLSILLIAIAYLFARTTTTVWQELTGTALVIHYLPLVVSIVFIPLAYWCRSRVIFGLSAITIAFSFVFSFKLYAIWHQGWWLAIAFVLPPALLWSYSDRIWQWRGSSRSHASDLAEATRSPQRRSHSTDDPTQDPFQPVARSLALWFLSIAFYWLAFGWWWNINVQNPASGQVAVDWRNWLNTVVLGIVAGLGWFQLRYELYRRRPQERLIHSGSVGLVLLVMAIVLIGHTRLGVGVTIAFNVMLFLLALGFIRDGLALTQRGPFWGGMVLLVLGIISRTLEYNTGLLLKSLVLAICGVGVIAAGLWFERRLQPNRLSISSSSQEEHP